MEEEVSESSSKYEPISSQLPQEPEEQKAEKVHDTEPAEEYPIQDFPTSENVKKLMSPTLCETEISENCPMSSEEELLDQETTRSSIPSHAAIQKRPKLETATGISGLSPKKGARAI